MLSLHSTFPLCEKLSVLAETMGYEYPGKEIDELWLLLFNITGHAIEFVHDRDAKKLYDIACLAKYKAIHLSEKMKEHICKNAKSTSEIQTVLINTNTWDVEEVVSFEVTSYHGISGFDVFDAQGNKLEFQIIDLQLGYSVNENADYVGVEILVKAKVPAMGYTCLNIVENGQSLKPLVQSNYIDYLSGNNLKICDDIVCFNNGNVEVKFYKGNIDYYKNLATNKILKSNSNKVVASLKFIQFSPMDSWLSSFEEIAVHEFVPGNWHVLINGPIRYKYMVEGKIAGENAMVFYSLDKGSMGMEVEVESNFVSIPEGMLVYSVKADIDSEVYADIPFGTEKREFFDDIFYNAFLKNNLNFASFEWGYSGQIYGKNWVSFMSCCNPLSIVSNNCSVYYIYRKKDEEMQLVLNRSMKLDTRKDDWAFKMFKEIEGNGINNYNFSLLFVDDLRKSSDIQIYHSNQIYSPVVVNKFGFCDMEMLIPAYSENEKKLISIIRTNKSNIINTAVYKEGEFIILRFFECDGITTTATINISMDLSDVKTVDFDGNEVLDINYNFSKTSKEVTILFNPYKIITLKLVLK